MALIGWLVLVVIGICCSVFWFLCAFNCLGQYNIGGVPNKQKAKVLVMVALIALGYGWYWVAQQAPFTISMDK